MKQRIALGVTTLALAGGLTLGNMSIAMASEPPECRGLFATVENVTVDENGVGTIGLVDVRCADGVNTLILIADNETLYHVSALSGWQSWDALSEELAAGEACDRTQPVVAGDRIAVSLDGPLGSSEDAVASKVMTVIPGRHTHRHQLGVVARVEGDTATIVDRNGDQVKMTLRAGLEVEQGQLVVMVANQVRSEVQLQAVQAHRVGDVMNRFERYMTQASNQGDFDQASGLMEQAHERHMNLLQGMQAKLQDRNQEQLAAAVGEAIDNEQSCYQHAVQTREQLRDQARESGWSDQGPAQSGDK